MDIISNFPRLHRLQITILIEPPYSEDKNTPAWKLEKEVNTLHKKSVIDFFSSYMESHPYAPLQELEFRFARDMCGIFGSSNSVWVVKLMRLYPTSFGAQNCKIETVRMFDDWDTDMSEFGLVDEKGLDCPER